ncbi:MAG: ribosomal RNA small subunit methyltransferase A [Chlamydiae bacterium]|nr:ribosomal RNA small subunit methyltransferase A [Chlamydiota bacterium]
MNDFLELDLDMVLKQHLKNCRLIKVVANLPYNITTPIIVKLLNSSLISSITIMVQKEVAHRIVAKKNSKDYSAFTLFVNYYAEPKLMFEVSKNCFYPKPKVDSAIVQLTLKKSLPNIDKEKFHELVRKAFHQRRKMLTSSLKEYCDGNLLKQALQDLNLKQTTRPEDLGLDQFITLFEKIF